MPIPLFTSEKPSNSETNLPPADAQQTSAEPVGEGTGQLSPTSRARLGGSIVGDGNGMQGRTTGGSEEAERRYEEAIEEEYAKREGGA